MVVDDQHANHDNGASTTKVAAPDTSRARLGGVAAERAYELGSRRAAFPRCAQVPVWRLAAATRTQQRIKAAGWRSPACPPASLALATGKRNLEVGLLACRRLAFSGWAKTFDWPCGQDSG